jgi:hypothetical protein
VRHRSSSLDGLFLPVRQARARLAYAAGGPPQRAAEPRAPSGAPWVAQRHARLRLSHRVSPLSRCKLVGDLWAQHAPADRAEATELGLLLSRRCSCPRCFRFRGGPSTPQPGLLQVLPPSLGDAVRLTLWQRLRAKACCHATPDPRSGDRGEASAGERGRRAVSRELRPGWPNGRRPYCLIFG